MAVRMPKRSWYDRPRVREFAFQVGANVTAALLTALILYLGAAATGVIRRQPPQAISLALSILGLVVSILGLGVALAQWRTQPSTQDDGTPPPGPQSQ
jgi:hypothetical protein